MIISTMAVCSSTVRLLSAKCWSWLVIKRRGQDIRYTQVETTKDRQRGRLKNSVESITKAVSGMDGQTTKREDW